MSDGLNTQLFLDHREIKNIGNGELLNFCVWSPNGQDVAFVRSNNVFIHRASGVETQLTNDGVDGVIYNGVPDWVYEGLHDVPVKS